MILSSFSERLFTWFTRRPIASSARVQRRGDAWFWTCRNCDSLGYGADPGPIHDAARRHMRRKH